MKLETELIVLRGLIKCCQNDLDSKSDIVRSAAKREINGARLKIHKLTSSAILPYGY